MEKEILLKLLNQKVAITVDYPIGSQSQESPFHNFPINFGYTEELFNNKGEPFQAYILGENRPLEFYHGKVVAVIFRHKSGNYLLVTAPPNMIFTKDAIKKLTHFQEQHYQAEYLFHPVEASSESK
ncbi:MAG: hypothetical protein WC907_06255 [Acholeplasmataceae bacterium]